MLNERHVNNNFTSMFTKGLSVVNYVVLSHLELIKCSNLEIQRVRHLIDSAELLHGGHVTQIIIELITQLLQHYDQSSSP